MLVNGALGQIGQQTKRLIDKKNGSLLYCSFFFDTFFSQAVLSDEYKGFWQIMHSISLICQEACNICV